MTFLNVDVTGAQEPKTMPEGEYLLVLLGVSTEVGKDSNKPYLAVRFEIMDEPFAKEIYHIISLPDKDDSEKVANGKAFRVREFFDCLGIPYGSDGAELEGCEGNTCWAQLIEREDDYGVKNIIKKFIPGR